MKKFICVVLFTVALFVAGCGGKEELQESYSEKYDEEDTSNEEELQESYSEEYDEEDTSNEEDMSDEEDTSDEEGYGDSITEDEVALESDDLAGMLTADMFGGEYMELSDEDEKDAREVAEKLTEDFVKNVKVYQDLDEAHIQTEDPRYALSPVYTYVKEFKIPDPKLKLLNIISVVVDENDKPVEVEMKIWSPLKVENNRMFLPIIDSSMITFRGRDIKEMTEPNTYKINDLSLESFLTDNFDPKSLLDPDYYKNTEESRAKFGDIREPGTGSLKEQLYSSACEIVGNGNVLPDDITEEIEELAELYMTFDNDEMSLYGNLLNNLHLSSSYMMDETYKKITVYDDFIRPAADEKRYREEYEKKEKEIDPITEFWMLEDIEVTIDEDYYYYFDEEEAKKITNEMEHFED